ncbi:hypothetical protein ACXM2N_03330 [Corynebacterium sp. ZY180755]
MKWLMEEIRPLNPVEVEASIRELTNRIAKGISVVSKRYGEFLEADRHFDREYATAFLTAEGSIKDREMAAKLESMPAREERDLADQAYKHADRLRRALELELSAMQSISASIRQAYGVAGRGEF